jgi:hypothetical protein
VASALIPAGSSTSNRATAATVTAALCCNRVSVNTHRALRPTREPYTDAFEVNETVWGDQNKGCKREETMYLHTTSGHDTGQSLS